MKLTLLHKGLLLVSIPLFFEIAMFSVLIALQDQVEREAQRLDHKKQVNQCINTIIRDVAKIGIMKKRYQRGATSTENLLRQYIDELLLTFSKLENLTKDDPELLKSVQLSKRAVLDAKEEFTNVRVELRKATSFDSVNEIIIASRKRLDNDLAAALNAGILDLANKTEPSEDLERNAQVRHQITILLRYALWISVLLGVALATLYSRNLTLRIMRVRENATRFANRQSLHRALAGDDEIAELDRAFHEASRLIDAATRKERAILENATDLIFSLDDDLVITSVNPSAESTIGKASDQLIGQPLTTIIASEEATMLKQTLRQMVSSTHKAELEVHLLRETMDPLNVVVSASYSPKDESFYCILHDVTSQRQMERLRQEVVAMITHDLRTPLHTIRNYLEMLKLGMLGKLNDDGDKLLALTDRESRRMSTLIDEVLTLEKLRSGNMTLNLENIELISLLDGCAKALELVAQEKTIAIEIEPLEVAEIRGDRVWLEQVLINILSNALKFSPPNSKVTIKSRIAGQAVEIRITDQGPGIAAEEQLKIFERFHRVSSTAHKVGSGLGLNICKELILLHHGSISCENEQGQGSTFIILLPRAVGVVSIEG
ncbi:MAG: ATP-binding protein [Candidatus Obscuribacterales bacterium]